MFQQKKAAVFAIFFMQLVSLSIIAQPVLKPAAISADTSKTKSIITASYGAYSNNSKVFVADLKRLLAVNPQLKLKDNKGANYQVVSFEITWKKKEISDDIRSGKQKTVYTYVGGDIKGNQLSESWRDEISKYIKKGEEITFETILYFDAKKKVKIKAPSLVLSII